MNTAPSTPTVPPSGGHSPLRQGWQRLKSDRMAMLGLYTALGIAIGCCVGPAMVRVAWGYGYETQDLAYGARPPSCSHWFGTDYLGRDLFTRVLYGAQISLSVGFLAASVAASIGTLYGATSGYLGGRVDALMMRLVDVIYTLPYMFVVVVLVTIFGKSLSHLFISLGLVAWLMTARIVRGQVLSIKERDFVLAARTLGVRGDVIVLRHIIPNTLGPIITYFTLSMPTTILQEAFLSFLGLGVQAPRPSLGALINDGAQHMSIFWWELAFPAGLMTLLLFALNFLGDGVRAALDPQLRSRPG